MFPLDFFSLFFTDEVYEYVLKMTNDRMDRYLKAKPQNVLKINICTLFHFQN